MNQDQWHIFRFYGGSMKFFKLTLIFIILLSLGFFLYFQNTQNEIEADTNTSSQPQEPVSHIFTVDTTPTVPTTERIGVNLTFWTTWGSNQYMKNVLMNPGFEGQINRIVVIVSQTDQQSFSDGKDLGQDDGFWKGASFEVRSGPSAGTKGTISNSLKNGANGLPQYFTEGTPPALESNDVVILTMEKNPNPVGQWWLSPEGVTVENSNPPPDSPSKYYVAMTPPESGAAECNFYLDTINDRAGNLLKVEGPWQLSFWIRGEGKNANLKIQFQRLNGTPSFVNEVARATEEWQQITYNFDPFDSTSVGALKLWISSQTPNTTVYLANVSLGPVQATNPTTAWRQDVIDMLKAMRPSYLRDWQGQLGDTFENRIGKDFARLSWNERMIGGSGSLTFGYSIPDVFELCNQVQANPWIIIPTTLSDSELEAFGEFLAQNPAAANFSEIILEFGNENWNWIFRSLGIPIPAAHGPVADRAFEKIAATAGSHVKIRRVINGQFYNPGLTLEFAKTAKEYDTMAVAPYFLFTLDEGTPAADILKKMFETNDDLYKQLNDGLNPLKKNLAVYEVNLHTMQGTMAATQVNEYVTASVSGSALAKRLIDGMFQKASPQLVFCFAGYDGQSFDQKGFVKLWGIVRDVSPTKRVRPTGLALTMLNQVIGGSLHPMKITAVPKEDNPPAATTTTTETPNVTAAAFRKGDRWEAAVVNCTDEEQRFLVRFPDDGRTLPTYINHLASNSYMDNNEDSENVKIVQEPVTPKGRDVIVVLPPYGLSVLTAEQLSSPSTTAPKNTSITSLQ